MGGGITPTVVSDGLIWMNGAHAENTQVKYYQLKDSKRVVINASWVILKAPEQGQTNNGLLIGRVPDSLKPSYVVSGSMSDCWTAILYTNGEIRAWCSDESRYNVEIPSGSITLCLEYETK